MGWTRQYTGQVYRVGMTKGRKPFRLMCEILIPFFLISSLAYIKSTTESGYEVAAEYTAEALRIPTLDDIVELPTLASVLAGEPKGLWYLENMRAFYMHGSSNLAWTCDLESAPPTAKDLPDFCEQLKLVVVPEDANNATQARAAADFKAFLLETSRVPEQIQRALMDASIIASGAALDKYITGDTYGTEQAPRVGAAVVFRSEHSYVIRVNKTSASQGENIPGAFRGATSDLSPGRTAHSQRYLMSGLLSLQQTVDAFVLGRASGKDVTIDANQFAMPTNEYNVDEFWLQAGSSLALFMMLATLYPIAIMINNLVLEKENKFRELMFMMGLEPSAYMSAWLTLFMLFFIMQAAWLTLITVAGGLFEQSATSVIFLYYLLYLFASIAHVFLVAAFFERTTLATMVGTLFAFGGYFLFTTFDTADTAFGAKLAVSIFHPTAAFGFGTSAFAAKEGGRVGVTWDNLDSLSEGNYSVQTCFLVLVLDFFLYLALAVYVDAIVPTSSGAARESWHWPVTSLRRPFSRANRIARDLAALKTDTLYKSLVEKQETDEAVMADTRPFEPVPESLRVARSSGRCIVLNDLHKRYRSIRGSVHAVRGLTLTMYEGQITALLGHNGAGKSTASNVLSGLVSSTSGSALIYGLSCKTDMARIRKMLGVCPQQNIYSPLLSVEEHLHVFASIKGIPRREVSKRVKRVVAEVGLTKQLYVGASYLSGGMKRKLQLAIALLDSKICLLDEPTSGLDVTARQHVQRTIAKYREGRTIVLTTHYLDEADVLGDRIAIMSRGRVECCGSSLFLRSEYGVGYLLTLAQEVSTADTLRRALIDLVKRHVPNAEVVSDAGTELILKTELQASTKFPALLRELKREHSALELVGTPGIAVTNLDSVFLKVADNAGRASSAGSKASGSSESDAEVGHFAGNPAEDDFEGDSDDDDEQEDGGSARNPSKAQDGSVVVPVAPRDGLLGLAAKDSNRGLQLFGDDTFATEPLSLGGHVRVLLGKRVLIARRDVRAFCCQILIPAVFLFLGFVALGLEFTTPPAVIELSAATDTWNPEPGTTNPIPFSAPNTDFLVDRMAIPRLEPQRIRLGGEGNDTYCMDREFFEVTVNQSLTLLGLALPPAEPFLGSALSAVEAWRSVCNDTLNDYTSTLSRFSEGVNETRPLAAGSRYAAVHFNTYDTREQGKARVEYTVGFNFTGVHAMPFMINRINDGLLKILGDLAFALSAAIDVLPETKAERLISDGFSGFLTTLAIGIAFSFVPAGYAVFVVREKETKAWHQQLVNGVRPGAYWLSNFIFDSSMYVVPLLLTLVLIYAFDLTAFVDNIGAVVLLLVLYGAAVIPFTYCLSYLFTTASLAQFGSLLVNLFGSCVLLLVSFIMNLLSNWYLTNADLVYMYRLIPSFALAQGLLNIGNIGLLSFVLNSKDRGGDPSNPVEYTAWSADIAGTNIAFLAAEAIGYTLLLAFLQVQFRGGLCSSNKFSTFSFATDEESGILMEDDDVKAERRRIEDLSPEELCRETSSEGTSGMNAAFYRTRKVYSDGNVAVQSLSLGLYENECFGLLGANGAGKTTTVSMLAGEFNPTEGKVFINGHDVRRDQAAAQRSLGYCPQSDCLWTSLTVKEHLFFYGRIKGIPEHALPAIVDRTMRELTLKQYASKAAGSLSGGNKRKLSLAIATMGNPRLCILDEVSAGIDPQARRAIQRYVARLAKRTSVVLISHALDEVESVCNRIAIMVGGGVRCLGTVPHVKNKYASGYLLEAAVDVESEGQMDEHFAGLLAMLQERFHAGTKLVERQGLRARFDIPLSASVDLSDIFECLNAVHRQFCIDRFAVSQSSLESVFNYFMALAEPKKPKRKGIVQELPTRRA